MKRVNGIWLPDQEQHMLKTINETGGYHLDHLAEALKWVRNFEVAVECGAHVGMWTQVMAKQFGTIHAFEPAKDTMECLKRNLFGTTHVHLYDVAIGEEQGYAFMTDDEAYKDGSNTGGRFAKQVNGKQVGAVALMPIDAYHFESVGFMKFDIEGLELEALRGARDTIHRCKPVILIEDKKRCAARFGHGKAEALRYLEKEFGAKPVSRVRSDHIYSFE